MAICDAWQWLVRYWPPLLAQRTDWKETDLENWMRTVFGQDERIFGMALAFEPRQFDSNHEGLLYLSVSQAQRRSKRNIFCRQVTCRSTANGSGTKSQCRKIARCGVSPMWIPAAVKFRW